MTTIDTAAAAWNSEKLIARAAVIALLAAGMAGCALGGGGTLQPGATGPVAQAPTKPAPVSTAPQRGTVAIASVIGPPDNVVRNVSAQLGDAIRQRGIGVTTGPGQASNYTLRGYVVAARETAGTKLSYIWDVYGSAGHRVHRFTGEELIRGAGAGDPWASVSGQVIQSIATKTATELANWMPKGGQAGSVPVANVAPRTSPVQTAAVPRTPQPPTAPVAPRPQNVVAAPPVSSVQAIVPRVRGAPGDGSVSLAKALQRELAKNGISVANRGGASSYRVEGIVSVGPGNGGKQPIQIEWIVKDPKGQRLGTVSQKNEIPAGSLNGRWGGVADAAAAAATQGILRLLPTARPGSAG
ncbi:MAG: hypothetical protein KDJ36_08310 [Hyphomicrobiaceae bacterium]|nr:hypothetical protein [Hyphomicrobiaceae bacterium]